MNLRSTLTAAVFLASFGVVGCAGTARYIKVNSYPRGALIYVDDEPRGQTDFEKLRVDFQNRKVVTIRVEKDGYQTDGVVIDPKSGDELMFFLKKSPENDGILRVLNQLQRDVDRMSEKIQNLEANENEDHESE